MNDLYTKTVLTIIAVALVWIGINLQKGGAGGLTPTPAHAAPGAMAVNLVEVAGRAVDSFAVPAITVKFKE